MSRWYRAYEGTVTDPKLAEAAMIVGCSRSLSIATWHCILESAASVNNCGSFNTVPRRIAAVLCEHLDPVEALFAAFEELGLIETGSVSSWKKRQFQSDDSKDRVKKYRAKGKDETPPKRDVTACNGDVTPPETDTETEIDKKESPNGDSPSGDGPSLRPEHVFEGYQALAAELGLPVPRDFTPERRQLVRGRITQYSMDDFLAAFAKCRGSPFLRGDARGGRTPLTFDWLMKKANFQKVLEGNYD